MHSPTTQGTLLSFPTMIGTVSSRVPSCCLPTAPVVLGQVHLSTARVVICSRITITIVTAILLCWISQIKVVVYVSVCTTQIHIPFNRSSTGHVERCFGTHPSLSVNCPTTGRPGHS